MTLCANDLSVFQAGRKERSDALNSAIDKMTKKTRDLRRQVSTAQGCPGTPAWPLLLQNLFYKNGALGLLPVFSELKARSLQWGCNSLLIPCVMQVLES